MSRYGDNVTIGPANRMLMHWTYSGIVAVA
jgi:hypothetical protein